MVYIQPVNRITIIRRFFDDGILVVPDEKQLPEHPLFSNVPNYHVMTLMKTLVSRDWASRTYNWRFHYYTITPKGIEEIRKFLKLGEDLKPKTHATAAREERDLSDIQLEDIEGKASDVLNRQRSSKTALSDLSKEDLVVLSQAYTDLRKNSKLFDIVRSQRDKYREIKRLRQTAKSSESDILNQQANRLAGSTEDYEKLKKVCSAYDTFKLAYGKVSNNTQSATPVSSSNLNYLYGNTEGNLTIVQEALLSKERERNGVTRETSPSVSPVNHARSYSNIEIPLRTIEKQEDSKPVSISSRSINKNITEKKTIVKNNFNSLSLVRNPIDHQKVRSLTQVIPQPKLFSPAGSIYDARINAPSQLESWAARAFHTSLTSQETLIGNTTVTLPESLLLSSIPIVVHALNVRDLLIEISENYCEDNMCLAIEIIPYQFLSFLNENKSTDSPNYIYDENIILDLELSETYEYAAILLYHGSSKTHPMINNIFNSKISRDLTQEEIKKIKNIVLQPAAPGIVFSSRDGNVRTRPATSLVQDIIILAALIPDIPPALLHRLAIYRAAFPTGTIVGFLQAILVQASLKIETTNKKELTENSLLILENIFGSGTISNLDLNQETTEKLLDSFSVYLEENSPRWIFNSHLQLTEKNTLLEKPKHILRAAAEKINKKLPITLCDKEFQAQYQLPEIALIFMGKLSDLQRHTLSFLIDQIYLNNLNVVGCRTCYCVPTEKLSITAQKKYSEGCTVLAVSGTSAFSILTNIVGPNDPVIARLTDPDSINSIFSDKYQFIPEPKLNEDIQEKYSYFTPLINTSDIDLSEIMNENKKVLSNKYKDTSSLKSIIPTAVVASTESTGDDLNLLFGTAWNKYSKATEYCPNLSYNLLDDGYHKLIESALYDSRASNSTIGLINIIDEKEINSEEILNKIKNINQACNTDSASIWDYPQIIKNVTPRIIFQDSGILYSEICKNIQASNSMKSVHNNICHRLRSCREPLSLQHISPIEPGILSFRSFFPIKENEKVLNLNMIFKAPRAFIGNKALQIRQNVTFQKIVHSDVEIKQSLSSKIFKHSKISSVTVNMNTDLDTSIENPMLQISEKIIIIAIPLQEYKDKFISTIDLFTNASAATLADDKSMIAASGFDKKQAWVVGGGVALRGLWFWKAIKGDLELPILPGLKWTIRPLRWMATLATMSRETHETLNNSTGSSDIQARAIIANSKRYKKPIPKEFNLLYTDSHKTERDLAIPNIIDHSDESTVACSNHSVSTYTVSTDKLDLEFENCFGDKLSKPSIIIAISITKLEQVLQLTKNICKTQKRNYIYFSNNDNLARKLLGLQGDCLCTPGLAYNSTLSISSEHFYFSPEKVSISRPLSLSGTTLQFVPILFQTPIAISHFYHLIEHTSRNNLFLRTVGMIEGDSPTALLLLARSLLQNYRDCQCWNKDSLQARYAYTSAFVNLRGYIENCEKISPELKKCITDIQENIAHREADHEQFRLKTMSPLLFLVFVGHNACKVMTELVGHPSININSSLGLPVLRVPYGNVGVTSMIDSPLHVPHGENEASHWLNIIKLYKNNQVPKYWNPNDQFCFENSIETTETLVKNKIKDILEDDNMIELCPIVIIHENSDVISKNLNDLCYEISINLNDAQIISVENIVSEPNYKLNNWLKTIRVSIDKGFSSNSENGSISLYLDEVAKQINEPPKEDIVTYLQQVNSRERPLGCTSRDIDTDEGTIIIRDGVKSNEIRIYCPYSPKTTYWLNPPLHDKNWDPLYWSSQRSTKKAKAPTLFEEKLSVSRVLDENTGSVATILLISAPFAWVKISSNLKLSERNKIYFPHTREQSKMDIDAIRNC